MIHRELQRRRVYAAAEYAEEDRQPDLEQRRIPLAEAFGQTKACQQRGIQSILRGAPHSFAIVTCRYAGYTEDVALDDDFLELHLRPLTKPQMELLVRNWYRQVLDFETGRAEHAHVQAQACSRGSASVNFGQ